MTAPDPAWPNLGRVTVAESVTQSAPDAGRARLVVVLLAACVALMMTGFGIIMPVFARRLGELGDGVQALALMTVAFAVTQFIFAPILGSLADRYGRRPFVLLALAVFALTNVGYLLAQTTAVFILVRAMGGALTAGLFPAAMGIVVDTVPEQSRARWIGVVMGGYGAGFVFGPVVGGFLYDHGGFTAPFITSAVLGGLAFIAALVLVPETRPAPVRRREMLRQRRETAVTAPQVSVWQALPRPLSVFVVLLAVDFIGAFAFAFVEPQMVFFLYDQLGWTTTQFGLVVGIYGLAMVFGQTVLGQASDRWGRKPVIVVGVLLSSLLYFCLAYVRSFGLIVLGTLLAGLGAALIAPAVSAAVLDITARQHRSRIIGVKESVLALGGVAGPLLVVVASRWLAPEGIFLLAGGSVVVTAVFALFLLRPVRPLQAIPDAGLSWEINRQRCLAAEASLQGLVVSAVSARDARRG